MSMPRPARCLFILPAGPPDGRWSLLGSLLTPEEAADDGDQAEDEQDRRVEEDDVERQPGAEPDHGPDHHQAAGDDRRADAGAAPRLAARLLSLPRPLLLLVILVILVVPWRLRAG